MPTYNFECQGCGHRFDVRESIADHDNHREKCPKCKKKDVRQLLGVAAVKTSKKS